MIIPVTLLSEYQYCPRKIYYSKVLKIRVEPNEALVKGKIRHKIEEEASIRFDFIITKVSRGDFDFIFNLFRENYLELVRRTIVNNIKTMQKINLDVQTITNEFIETFTALAKQVAESIHEIVIEHKVLGKDILQHIKTEQTAEMFIESENLMLRGIIDSVEFTDENVVPIELKTGSMPRQGVWPSHKLQVGCYMLLCQEHYENKILLFQNWWEKKGYPDGIPDEADYRLEAAKKAPSWRRVCKSLLRNDYWCKGLGFTQQKSSGYVKYLQLMNRRKDEWNYQGVGI
jgi:CRISPR/Cas system-associated exonuclease Cas4 (RecB family)